MFNGLKPQPQSSVTDHKGNMTAPIQDNQQNSMQTEQKPNDKELNFRALEQKYQRELEKERSARLEAEKLAQEASKRQVSHDDDDDSEPYVDRKRLSRTLEKNNQQIKQETQSEIQRAVQTALQEEKKSNWLKRNEDFYDVLQHAEKLAQTDPELAETILEMPEGFERQKLVYKNIKALGLHQPKKTEPSIQERVDANRRSPYYQPSGVGSSPYAQVGDFSQSGQKNAYDKMQELKSRLRI